MNRDTRENLACKSISKKKQRTAVDVEDVRWEVAIMSSLPEHPNIVKLRAAYEDSEAVHLVMELCVTVKTKPVFVKVNELKPGTKGHNLTVKVVSSTTVLDKKSLRNSGNTRIAECLIGDDTASILFTACNYQGAKVVRCIRSEEEIPHRGRIRKARPK